MRCAPAPLLSATASRPFLDEAAGFAANPFPSTTAGAARQRWGLCEIEFEAMQVAAAGLPCLMIALAHLLAGEPLRQKIMRTPAYVLHLLHHGEGGRITRAVLYGKPREELPALVGYKAVSLQLQHERSPPASLRLIGPVQLDSKS